MTELTNKTVLADKGESAFVPIKQLIIDMGWDTDVDLDLMLFGVKKDDTHFAIATDQLTKKPETMGNLNAFPFIRHSGDEGVGASGNAGSTGKANTERITIAKIDDSIKELFIVAFNYTDAKTSDNKTFAPYGGVVNIKTDAGEVFEVPLNSQETGVAALIATINCENMAGPQLINKNEVMDLATFFDKIPGSNILGGQVQLI